jgi:hypothetical protein
MALRRRNRIDVPVHPVEKQLIYAAAEERNMTVAAFMRHCAHHVIYEQAEREAMLRTIYPQKYRHISRTPQELR